MHRTLSRCLFLSLLLATAPALAEGWRTTEPAVMYDAPSERSTPKLIVSGGFPLRQMSAVHGWYKVLSHSGESGWVAAAHLRRGKYAIVVADRAAARAEPHAAAAAVFFARRGVVLEVLGRARQGWLKVLHQDGEVAYLLETDSWLNF